MERLSTILLSMLQLYSEFMFVYFKFVEQIELPVGKKKRMVVIKMDKQQGTMPHDNLDNFSIDGKELPLYQVFQIINATTTNTQQAIHQIKDFCLSTTSEENLRTSLEFLYSYGFLTELDQQIERNLQIENPVNQRWARLYQIIRDRRQEKAKPYDYTRTDNYLERLEALDIQDKESECLRDFLYVYAYFERKQYSKLGKYADRILLTLHELKDPMMKELFSIRFDEVQVIYHWKRNEMIIARKFGYRILNTTKSLRKKIDIHNMMALGFLYDSYESAIYHVNEALKIARNIDFKPAIEGIKNYTLPFISAYNGVTDGVSSADQAEKAHLALAKGDKKTCIQLLSELKTLTPFQQYYLGKAREDQSLLEESYQRFMKEQSDYFFAMLPLKELRKVRVKN
ncbi:AimR family lysis-lysogeny pheromone receptor [Aquibacillus albus]|uniref:Uncharacterized protein n=1 Tax=Aquibacillus albus TaxID=1168171 RepID=A0ABS2MZH3_9BACI|nr:AimR family lysis-lysogeny pheromone receptor [Aquibacillus albus]MBM7571244.1 hypothetical protein [Aquibacillus albus]